MVSRPLGWLRVGRYNCCVLDLSSLELSDLATARTEAEIYEIHADLCDNKLRQKDACLRLFDFLVPLVWAAHGGDLERFRGLPGNIFTIGVEKGWIRTEQRPPLTLSPEQSGYWDSDRSRSWFRQGPDREDDFYRETRRSYSEPKPQPLIDGHPASEDTRRKFYGWFEGRLVRLEGRIKFGVELLFPADSESSAGQSAQQRSLEGASGHSSLEGDNRSVETNAGIGGKRTGADVPIAQPAENVFRKEGQDWTISFRGKQTRIRDWVGTRYLAYLLQRPGQVIGASQLVAAVSGGVEVISSSR
jgi:hypothetical protein